MSWYGGEPLLAFDTICELTKQFKDLDLEYDNASLITNGYLLDQDKISALNDLKISSIQITLDGPQKVHDSRRFLAGGGPTFERILENITSLMHSDYTGNLIVRVNVDRKNLQSYSLRAGLSQSQEVFESSSPKKNALNRQSKHNRNSFLEGIWAGMCGL